GRLGGCRGRPARHRRHLPVVAPQPRLTPHVPPAPAGPVREAEEEAQEGEEAQEAEEVAQAAEAQAQEQEQEEEGLTMIDWPAFVTVVVASLVAACGVVTVFALALRLGDGEAAWR